MRIRRKTFLEAVEELDDTIARLKKELAASKANAEALAAETNHLRGLLMEQGDIATKLREERAELLASLKALLGQVHDDCLRDGEEKAVAVARALVARIEAAS